MTKSEKLRDFILQYLDHFITVGGEYPDYDELPEFELYAQDYLDFAEQELNAHEKSNKKQDKTRHLINCVTNLKRALDCQLDVFLHTFNLHKLFTKKNLKIEKKLDFLKAINLFSSRSLTRLNTIRNKIEHKYESPKIVDIEVYYDLIVAFIALLQRPIFNDVTLWIHTQEKDEDGGYEIIGSITIKYNSNEPLIEAKLEHELWIEAELKFEQQIEYLKCKATEYTGFAYFFRVMFLLYQHQNQHSHFLKNGSLAIKIAELQ